MNPPDCVQIYEDAEFYDQEFAQRGHEIPFFLKQARLANGPILEVACGTGRITLPIALDGISITGLDVSRPMLERARRKAEAVRLLIPFWERDCRRIDVMDTFALIFSATNAMQHLLDIESVCAFLGSASQALRPGGLLILDVFNPNPAKLARSLGTRYHHKSITDSTGVELRVEAATQYHSAKQVLELRLYYLHSGRLVRTKEINLRCFFPEELISLCRLNGFEVIRRCGNYDETPFQSDSPKQILFCRRASTPTAGNV